MESKTFSLDQNTNLRNFNDNKKDVLRLSRLGSGGTLL